MSDPALIIAVIVAFLTAFGTSAAVASAIIQHRRTPKLSELPITPTCTTILGVDMHNLVHYLPVYSRRTLGERQKSHK